jgi:hypothetical protein
LEKVIPCGSFLFDNLKMPTPRSSVFSFCLFALLGGQALSQVWVFLIAPLAGSTLAVSVYQLLNSKPKGIQA